MPEMNNLQNFLFHQTVITQQVRKKIYLDLMGIFRQFKQPIYIFFKVINLMDLVLKRNEIKLDK